MRKRIFVSRILVDIDLLFRRSGREGERERRK